MSTRNSPFIPFGNAPKAPNKVQLTMELRVEDNKMICSLNLLLQLSLLIPEVLFLREQPSTAASSTIQPWITASTIFRALQFKLELIRAPAIVWPETALTKNSRKPAWMVVDSVEAAAVAAEAMRRDRAGRRW